MVVVIGAGISGLSVGYFLEKAGVPYIILEAKDKPGGYLSTLHEEPYLFELGPNSILVDDEITTFLQEIGLKEEIVSHSPVSQNRYIYKNGQYRKLPSGPVSLITSNFFSPRAKWSILRELWHNSPPPQDESVAGFFERHFCREVVDYAVAPFVTGIYAGDPDKLLMDKVFPRVCEMEKQYGSVLKGFVKGAKKTRRRSINFRKGMTVLPEKLSENLNIQYNTPATSIMKAEGGMWSIKTPHDTIEADQVVLTTNAHFAGKLTNQSFPELAKALSEVVYVPMTIVHTVYDRSQVGHLLDGFGGLNPKVENRFAAGSIWASSVFEGKCSTDEVMITSFIGGSGSEEKTRLNDDGILIQLLPELSGSYDINGMPKKTIIQRWDKAIVQYDANINPVYSLLPKAEKDTLYVCANWYQGVSIADCIKKAQNLASKINATRQ